jgi:hypothetical protein
MLKRTTSLCLADLGTRTHHTATLPGQVGENNRWSITRAFGYATLSIALMFTSGCGYGNLRSADGKHYVTINKKEYNIADVGFVWLPNASDTGCSPTKPNYFATSLIGSVSVNPTLANSLPMYDLDRWMAVIPGQWNVTLSGTYSESRVVGNTYTGTYHSTTYETTSYGFKPQVVNFQIKPLETVLVTCEASRSGLDINQVRNRVTEADFGGCYLFACKMGNPRLR